MNAEAVVEIAVQPDGHLAAPLITAAYLASRSVSVALVLNEVVPQAVDRLLNPVVLENLNVLGVRYVDGNNEAEIIKVVEGAKVVVATTDTFKSILADHGLPFLDPGAAGHLLTKLTS